MSTEAAIICVVLIAFCLSRWSLKRFLFWYCVLAIAYVTFINL